MFYMRTSVVLFFVVIELSIFEEILTYAKSSHSEQHRQYEEDARILKAIQTSMAEWKARKMHNRQKREVSIVCYGQLGCFEDSGPYGYIDMLPSSPEEIDTKFFIYSTKNRSADPFLQFSFHDISQYSLLNETLTTTTTTTTQSPSSLPNNRVDRQDRNVKRSSSASSDKNTFDPMKVYDKFGNMTNSTMRIIVHGFGSNCKHEWIDEMRAALMAVEECFVMCVEWEKGAILPNYVKAAANSRLVGKQLAFLLKGLEKNNGLNFTNVHLIGFSLGAHASGFAGAELQNLSRITGLDPAGPLFEGSHIAARLDESDAKFVDVIHSNGENLILGGLGSWQPMGHVDFYPNGGKIQHGCSNLFLGAVTDIIWTSPKENEGRSLCNHRRAYKFFIDSIAPRCLFPSFPCSSYEAFLSGDCFHCLNRKAKSIRRSDSNEIKIHEKVDSVCGLMGYYSDKSTGRGQLYLRTRDDEPFCAHQYRIRVHSAAARELPLHRTIGRVDIELESEGGLSESFQITDRDDQEIFAGEYISKIIVPHPALFFPPNRTVTITYQVYRGWLTRGLSTWELNKVILSDSFGESFSICKSIELESGVSVEVTLYPGDCHEEELLFAATSTTTTTTKKPKKTSSKTPNKSSEIIELGKHMIIPNDSSITAPESDEKSLSLKASSENWKPIETTQPMIKKVNDTTFLNTGERMPKKAKTEKRSFGESSDEEENVERNASIMYIRDDSASLEEQDEDVEEVNADDAEGKFITVQLFPYRLGDIFEKAEKYARNIFSNIFNGETSYEKASNSNNAITIVSKSPSKSSRKFENDLESSASSIVNNKVENEMMTMSETQNTVQTLQQKLDKSQHMPMPPPIEKLLLNNSDNKNGNENEKESVKIDLPTYKPPMRENDKIFIPIERESSSA